MIEYDLHSNTSREAPRMNKGRMDHRSCVLKDQLFVCGGKDKSGGSPVPSVEVLDLQEMQQWHLVLEDP